MKYVAGGLHLVPAAVRDGALAEGSAAGVLRRDLLVHGRDASLPAQVTTLARSRLRLQLPLVSVVKDLCKIKRRFKSISICFNAIQDQYITDIQ